MPKINFAGEYYTSKSPTANAQRLVNWFTETDKVNGNQVLYPAPGLMIPIVLLSGLSAYNWVL